NAARLTRLAPGALNIKVGDADETIFVSGGFLEVSNNSVIVLADTAKLAEQIDQARTEDARRQAQEELAQTQSDVERAELLGALERAMTRLRVAELARRRSGRRLEIPRSDSEQ